MVASGSRSDQLFFLNAGSVFFPPRAQKIRFILRMETSQARERRRLREKTGKAET